MWEEQIIIGEAVTEYIIKNKSRLSAQDMRTLSYFRESAVCVDSPIGEYRCAVEIRYSPQSGKKPICCDTCLQYEVYNLNKRLYRRMETFKQSGVLSQRHISMNL